MQPLFIEVNKEGRCKVVAEYNPYYAGVIEEEMK